MSAAVFAFTADAQPAGRLAAALGCAMQVIDLHRFPDREALPSVRGVPATAIVYCALNDPDPKLMPLLLAADALRRAGAARRILVAPYMPYLRQDKVFAPGQSLSRDVLGDLLGRSFERIVTVEPHLHRTRELTPVFAGTPVETLSAAPLLAKAIGADGTPLVVGPDAESEPWAAAVAAALGADHVVFAKTRFGDRQVSLTLPVKPDPSGRRVVIIDDICSSGGTLEAAVEALAERGAAHIEIAVVHALFDARVQGRLTRAGAHRILSSDSCAHPTNAIHLADLIAGAIYKEL